MIYWEVISFIEVLFWIHSSPPRDRDRDRFVKIEMRVMRFLASNDFHFLHTFFG